MTHIAMPWDKPRRPVSVKLCSLLVIVVIALLYRDFVLMSPVDEHRGRWEHAESGRFWLQDARISILEARVDSYGGQANEALRRLERLSDGVEAICNTLPGRSDCPRLVQESRE